MDRSIISWLYLNSWIHQINHAKRVHRINASGSKTPREIRAAGRAAHRNSEKLALLLDEWWTSCQGQWKESNLYLRMSESTRHRKCGARCWLTRAELVQKYGDVEAATRLKTERNKMQVIVDRAKVGIIHVIFQYFLVWPDVHDPA